MLFVISRGTRRPKTNTDPYTTALNQLIHDDWDGALRNLRLAIQSGHTSPDAYIKLGSLLRRRGDATAAFQIHQSLTVRQDLSADERAAVMRCLVDDYRALGQRADALRTLQEISELERDTAIHREIAEEALHSTDFATAEKAIREAQRQDTALDGAEVGEFLARIAARCLQRERPSEAKNYLQQALKEDGSCERALLLMGDLSYKEGDHESALYYWQKLVFAAAAEGGQLHERLEKVYFDLGKFGDIERVYAQILEKRPRDLQTMLASARIGIKKGEVEEAERLLRQALEIEPRSDRAFRMLADLLLDLGKTEQTRELIAAYVERREKDET